jgi:hypothetical protein
MKAARLVDLVGVLSALGVIILDAKVFLRNVPHSSPPRALVGVASSSLCEGQLPSLIDQPGVMGLEPELAVPLEETEPDLSRVREK